MHSILLANSLNQITRSAWHPKASNNKLNAVKQHTFQLIMSLVRKTKNLANNYAEKAKIQIPQTLDR